MYRNSLWWDETFATWSFDAGNAYKAPSFVINSTNKFCIHIRDVGGLILHPNFIHSYPDRIVEFKVNVSDNFDALRLNSVIKLHQLKCGGLRKLTIYSDYKRVNNLTIEPLFSNCKTALKTLELRGIAISGFEPLQFSNIQSLSLSNCTVDSNCFQFLPPQLIYLKLCNIKGLDISLINGTPEVFAKLQHLIIFGCKLDVAGVLKKCCRTLKYLEIKHCQTWRLNQLEGCQFPVIKSVEFEGGLGRSIIKFLSMTTRTLENLKISLNCQVNFYMLVSTGMPKLRCLSLYLKKMATNLSQFLLNCPSLDTLKLEFDKLFFAIFTPSRFIPSSCPTNYNAYNYVLQYLLYPVKNKLRNLKIKNNFRCQDLYISLYPLWAHHLPIIEHLETASIEFNDELLQITGNFFSGMFDNQYKVSLLNWQLFMVEILIDISWKMQRSCFTEMDTM